MNEKYDEGQIIFQERFEILPEDTETIAEKIHVLEHKHYPAVIEKLINEIPDD